MTCNRYRCCSRLAYTTKDAALLGDSGHPSVRREMMSPSSNVLEVRTRCVSALSRNSKREPV